MRNYKNIKAYQLADDLVIQIYQVTKNFPKDEVYGLSSQLRRAAVSIPTNIAEGASRQHNRDYLNFLYIARASLAETEYLLNLCHRLKYLTDQKFEMITQDKQKTAKTLFGLIAAVTQEAQKTQ